MDTQDPKDTRHLRAVPDGVWDDEMGQRRCTAKAKTTGNRCKRRPIAGGNVCAMHGGKAPQVQRAARLRLAELVDPAVVILGRAMAQSDTWAVRVRAAEAVLDRAGYPRRHEIDVDDAREHLTDRIRQLIDEETA